MRIEFSPRASVPNRLKAMAARYDLKRASKMTFPHMGMSVGTDFATTASPLRPGDATSWRTTSFRNRGSGISASGHFLSCRGESKTGMVFEGL